MFDAFGSRKLDDVRASLGPGGVIDRVVDLDEVLDGIRYLESRRARGKVVVRIP